MSSMAVKTRIDPLKSIRQLKEYIFAHKNDKVLHFCAGSGTVTNFF